MTSDEHVPPGRPVTIAVIDDQDVVLSGVRTWINEDRFNDHRFDEGRAAKNQAAEDQAAKDQAAEDRASGDRRVEIVYTAADLDGLAEGPAGTADVLVVDLRIRGELVFDQIAELAAAGRRVVVFSQHAEPEIVHRAEQAGALAYITKETGEGRRHLIEAVLTVAGGETYTTPSQAGAMLAATGHHRPRFSEQELRTMRLWLGGLTRAGVARQLGISEHTVKQYLGRAREKYAKAGREASTRLDLYREARKDGIVDD